MNDEEAAEQRRLERNAKQRAYHQHTLVERKAGQAEYRERNRERERERVTAWRATDPERARASNRASYAKYRDQRLQYRRDRQARAKDQIRAANNRRKAQRRGAPINDLTAAQWRAIKIAYGQRCAYCRAEGVKLTMDHVVPLAKGGPHTAANVVPACMPCNNRKKVGPPPPFQPAMLME